MSTVISIIGIACAFLTWTLRKEDLPAGVTYDEFCDALFKKSKVDAVHTDSPDLGVNYVKNNFKNCSK